MNLNLLKSFDALMLTRNVSEAAEMLYITQPAMSNLLRQLREMMQDEVLIRRKKAMIPTPKALKLAPEIHALLQRMEQLLILPSEFDPASSTKTFTLGMNDYIEFVLLHQIIAHVEKYAPHITFKIMLIDNVDLRDVYEKQGVDLCIGVSRNPDAQLNSEELFTETIVCAANKNHPLFKGGHKLTLKQYLAAQQLVILPPLSMPDVALTERALTKIGARRDVKVTVTHVLATLQTLKHTHLIGTLPRTFAKVAERAYQLKLLELPLKIPSFKVSGVWHKIHQYDPGHQWLREQIKFICERNLLE